MGRKITIVLVHPGLPWDLRVLPKVIAFGRYFDRGMLRDVKISRALQVNGAAFKISAVRNALEEVSDVDTYPIILDFSCIKQDLHIETP